MHREVRGSDNTGEASGVDIGSIPLDRRDNSEKGRADARAPREGHPRSSAPIVADVNLESPTDKPVSDKPVSDKPVSDKPSKVVAEKVELAEEAVPEPTPETPTAPPRQRLHRPTHPKRCKGRSTVALRFAAQCLGEPRGGPSQAIGSERQWPRHHHFGNDGLRAAS